MNLYRDSTMMLKQIFGISVLLVANSVFSAEIAIENNQLRLAQPLVFETQSEVLTTESQASINDIKTFLDKKSYISTLRIEGHVSSFDDEQKNLLLSAERALSVAKALVEVGVDCQRLLTVAFGSSKPTAANTTPEGRVANSRIELVIAALRGKAIGGMPLEGVGQPLGDACAK
jgi:outer membrane protein OmpA-like peptidoglycan-associated protein